MTEPARTLQAVEEVLRSADLLVETVGSAKVAVSGVSQDSRSVESGDLFLAWKGLAVDAHDYVASAAEQGAAATVVERVVDVDIPQLVVTDGRRAAALAAEAVMGYPSHDLLAVGVTGTNGKTTTAMLIQHLLGPETPTAVIGTLGVVDSDGVRPGTEGLTTPGPVQVAVWLRDLADGGLGAVVVEASSHALEQARLDGVRFDIGIFTNLTQDHLDYHGDMAEYLEAKAHLVQLVRPYGTIIVNGDEPAWSELHLGPRTLRTFATKSFADLTASELALEPHRTTFSLQADGESYRVVTPLVGRYNVENALGAVAAARAAGVAMETIVERLQTAPQVSGRLEAVVTDPFSVLIDYAHTPAALEGALSAVKPLTRGRVIAVFGAGGDRDRTKRAPMGAAARRLADVLIVTSDNPRTEDPDAIIDDVLEGVGDAEYVRFADRREAIYHALQIAKPGDTVILTGKGHEMYQSIGGEKLPFDERAIVVGALHELGAA